MLTLVDEEQDALARERVGDRSTEWAVRFLLDAEDTGERRGDERPLAQRGERHPPHAVGKRVRKLCGELEREPSLSGSSGAYQRQQPDGGRRGTLDELLPARRRVPGTG